jgi:endogenous inhibitor of DNA gyrase (YacG/DUF329 family)
MTSESKDDTKKPPCALCGKPVDPEFHPFCSKRCKLRDLARWLGADEPYVIPGEPLAGLVDENGEPLVDLEGLDGGNVVYADFGPKSDEEDD